MEAGFDLVQPLAVAAYNATAHSEHRLPDFGRSAALGVVIGNTRALWPRFVRAWENDPDLRQEPHPLDAYVSRSLPSLVASVTNERAELVFSHVTRPRAFPIQRAAEAAGLAAISPSHLAIHRDHGPWIAIRAVVVIDVEGPRDTPPAPRPCDTCAAPCVPALEHALAVSGPALNGASISANAAAWIAIRDACPIGHPSRYSPPQLAHHYGLRTLPPNL